MAEVLDKILTYKREEIAAAKKVASAETMVERAKVRASRSPFRRSVEVAHRATAISR